MAREWVLIFATGCAAAPRFEQLPPSSRAPVEKWDITLSVGAEAVTLDGERFTPDDSEALAAALRARMPADASAKLILDPKVSLASLASVVATTARAGVLRLGLEIEPHVIVRVSQVCVAIEQEQHASAASHAQISILADQRGFTLAAMRARVEPEGVCMIAPPGLHGLHGPDDSIMVGESVVEKIPMRDGAFDMESLQSATTRFCAQHGGCGSVVVAPQSSLELDDLVRLLRLAEGLVPDDGHFSRVFLGVSAPVEESKEVTGVSEGSWPVAAPKNNGKPPSVVIFGGSDSAARGEEASLEAQVQKLSGVLAERKPLVLFGVGKRGARVREAERDIFNLGALDLLLNLEAGRVKRRASEVARRGSATKRKLLSALKGTAKARGGTVVFGVGHGYEPDDEGDGSIALAGRRGTLWVSELAGYLDRSRRRGPTAFVLGHCYSGAFADIVYRGDSWKVAKPSRCAFSAVPADRVSVGCTPLRGYAGGYVWVMAEAFEKPGQSDINADGQVSLREAHAYARIHDTTANVPFSSSEGWLRERKSVTISQLTARTVLAMAPPEEAAVLKQLRPPQVTDSTRVGEVQEQLAQMKEELSRQHDDVEEEWHHVEAVGRVVLRRLRLRRDVMYAVKRGVLPEKMQAELSENKHVKELVRAVTRAQETMRAAYEGEAKAAKIERWVRAAEVAVMLHTLKDAGDGEGLAVLEELSDCESMVVLPR